MALKLITAPLVKPLSLSDVGEHVRADLTLEGTLVELYISAITAKAENYTGRALISQVWELELDLFPCTSAFDKVGRAGAIKLPLSPVQSIESVKYLDADGVLQTLANTEYVLTGDDPSQLVPAYGKTWPATRTQPGAVVIQYTAGYGDTTADVPEAIRAWMMLNIATLYENRETVITGKGQFIDLNTYADALLNSYRLVRF